MIDIKVVGSGSSGNCYLADFNGTKILLEAGLPFKKIQKALNYKVSEVEACLVTHEHLDHAKSVKYLARAGVNIYMTAGTGLALNEYSHRIKIFATKTGLSQYRGVKIKDLLIQPFQAVHDVREPVNFYISDRNTGESLLFVTDTAYMKYKIPDVDVLMVECNYVKSILDKKVDDGELNISLRNRIVRNHMSLETLLEALKGVNLKRLRKTYVIHLSDSNSDEKLILEEIQKATGVMVEIC